MNYLAHHRCALNFAPSAPPGFFAGNLLPDLLGMSGDGRLRRGHLADVPANPLADGARFHLAADHAFHLLPEFIEATRLAGGALRAAPFSRPPHRVFFLAHVLTELALDAALLRQLPGLAADLYGRLEAVPAGAVARAVAGWLGRPASKFSNLENTYARFVAHRWLHDYERPEGLAAALDRVSRRASVEGFGGAGDLAVLADVFVAFEPRADDLRATLFDADAATGGGAWYNTGDASHSQPRP